VLEAYRKHVDERAAEGVVPQPLDAAQTAELVELLKSPPAGEEEFIMNLLEERIPAGVDEAAYVKAGFLTAVISGQAESPLVDRKKAVEILGTMLGGYNIQPMIAALDDDELAETAVAGLSKTLLMFDAFHDVKDKMDKGNAHAKTVMESWANAEWYLANDEVADKVTVTVFKVPGETNTDDLSPAVDAWSRPDIPLHSLAFHKFPREGFTDKPLEKIEELKKLGHPVAYVGDVVGTGSSRKSATNSVLWLMGNDIPNIPNRREGGYVLGGKIAPIFFNTMEDAGALPIEVDVSKMEMGDVIDIYPHDGKVCKHGTDEVLGEFEHKTEVLMDEVRAGGRIPLIIGRGLTTGPMTRDELKDLACLGFSADLVMQSFCHTAAYPKPIDVDTHHNLPDFMMTRGGVSLNPGDGIIHSWMNRMLLPDTVGTGGDSHS